MLKNTLKIISKKRSFIFTLFFLLIFGLSIFFLLYQFHIIRYFPEDTLFLIRSLFFLILILFIFGFFFIINYTKQKKKNISNHLLLKEKENEISELKKEIKNHKIHLENKIQKRTDKLHKEIYLRQQIEEEINSKIKKLEKINNNLAKYHVQLYQSEKIASLYELSANIAHELNQPLNNSRIICQSIYKNLKKGKIDSNEFNTDINEVISQIDKMAEIIHHMRKFSRRSIDQYSEKVNINTIINDIMKIIGENLKNFNIKINTTLDETLPDIICNRGDIEQILMNLLINAKEALISKNITNRQITIVTSYNNKLHNIKLKISDNGTGIPSKIKDKIFNPFFSTKLDSGGTGLGLSSAYHLVQELKGIMDVESKKNEGTDFIIILPVLQKQKK